MRSPRKLTLAAEEDRQVPELSHVEGFEDLTLIAGSISIEADCGVASVVVLVCKRNASTDWYLCTDNAVSAVEALCEHMHRSTFPVSNAFSSSQQLAND